MDDDDEDDDNDGKNNKDKDHNNNTTIKQYTGERGADNDEQLAVGDVDDDRWQRRQALEGEDNGGGLG